jgi:alanyl-tRNA synthetase
VLANAIRSRAEGDVVIVVAGVAGDAVSLLVVASDGAVKAGAHAGNLLKAATAYIDGKGGGGPAQAQGGGKKVAGVPEALHAMKRALL